MGKIDGVVVGIVKGLDDPEKLGRIELHFPWMSDQNKSYWARVATLMAGPGRGSWFQPEPEDEVLVAFEHGNTQHPYVVGFLWNKQDKPPRDGIDGKVRRVKTVSGHVLDFDDRDGKHAVKLTTAAGHKVHLDDQGSRITIELTGGAGGPPRSVELAPGGITLSSPLGTITLDCLQLNLNPAAMMSVKTPFAQFSGVVMTQTIVASNVVSTTYSPGIGNLI